MTKVTQTLESGQSSTWIIHSPLYKGLDWWSLKYLFFIFYTIFLYSLPVYTWTLYRSIALLQHATFSYLIRVFPIFWCRDQNVRNKSLSLIFKHPIIIYPLLLQTLYSEPLLQYSLFCKPYKHPRILAHFYLNIANVLVYSLTYILILNTKIGISFILSYWRLFNI